MKEFQTRLDDARKKRMEQRRKERILERKIQRRIEKEERVKKEKEDRERRGKDTANSTPNSVGINVKKKFTLKNTPQKLFI